VRVKTVKVMAVRLKKDFTNMVITSKEGNFHFTFRKRCAASSQLDNRLLVAFLFWYCP
jgi:hypothetical protein